MKTTTRFQLADTEEEAVMRWRYDELVRAGYGSGVALRLAKRRDVDLHLAERLVRDGCPADTAVRILS